MGNDDDAELALEFVDAFLDALRGDGVEGAGGFVHEQDFRFHGKGAGDAQALLLAAGEPERRRVQAVLHLFEDGGAAEAFLHLVGDERFVALAVDAQAVGHVFKNRLRERRRLLEDHAHAAAQVHHIEIGGVDVLLVQRDQAFGAGAGDKVVHAVEAAEERALAAS